MSRIEEIRARAAAAMPGPWRWGGNMDNSDPRLMGRSRSAPGWSEVLGHLKRARHAKDPELDVETLKEYYPDPDDQRAVINNYLFSQTGDPIYESRLALNEDGLLVEARTKAIYEVAKNATSRKDPKVYRADIVGLRHPDAEFIAHSREDIEFLLAEVDRLRSIADVAVECIDSGGYDEHYDALVEAVEHYRDVAP